jgi:hypothetical protein
VCVCLCVCVRVSFFVPLVSHVAIFCFRPMIFDVLVRQLDPQSTDTPFSHSTSKVDAQSLSPTNASVDAPAVSEAAGEGISNSISRSILLSLQLDLLDGILILEPLEYGADGELQRTAFE